MVRFGGSLVVGLFAGAAGFLFSESLRIAIEIHRGSPPLLFALPFASLSILFWYQRWGKGANRGQALLLEELEKDDARPPRRLLPSLWISAVISQLVGASVGREGGAVQIGGAVGSLLRRWVRSSPAAEMLSRYWIIAGMSGGFTGCFGTPATAALFALEVRSVSRIRGEGLLEAILGAIAGTLARGILTPLLLGAVSEPLWPDVSLPALTLEALQASGVLILALSALSWAVPSIWRKTGSISQWLWSLPPGGARLALPLGLGGLLATAFAWGDPEGRYQGLSLETICGFFVEAPRALDLPAKLLATGVSLALGFKGGEFIPLAYLGAAAGSGIAAWFHQPLAPFAAAGFIALFGSLAQTPLSMVVLGVELFAHTPTDLRFSLFFGLFSWLTFLCSPSRGIYGGQLDGAQPQKWRLIHAPWRYFG